MTQDDFNRQYHEAIIKATVGVHIIMTAEHLTLAQKAEDVLTTTNLLADGTQMDRETVYADVAAAYNQLKPALERLQLETR